MISISYPRPKPSTLLQFSAKHPWQLLLLPGYFGECVSSWSFIKSVPQKVQLVELAYCGQQGAWCRLWGLGSPVDLCQETSNQPQFYSQESQILGVFFWAHQRRAWWTRSNSLSFVNITIFVVLSYWVCSPSILTRSKVRSYFWVTAVHQISLFVALGKSSDMRIGNLNPIIKIILSYC